MSALDAFLYGLGLIGLIGVLVLLARWARKGGKGVVLFASLFGFGAIADPLFEKQLRTVRDAEDRTGGQDESGDPPA